MKKIRINFLSDGHLIIDDLIYHRYALSLAKRGFIVRILARSTELKTRSDLVKLIGVVPENCNRFLRFSYYLVKLFIKALLYTADIYIICNPSLLIWGLIYKFLFRKKVIYNAQENYQVKFMDREWIPKFIATNILPRIEKFISNKMDGIIVTDSISFRNYDPKKTIILPNYPIFDNISFENKRFFSRYNSTKKEDFHMVYVGSISKNRGLEIYKSLIKKLPQNFYIHLYGKFASAKDKDSISTYERIIYHGYLDHSKLLSEIENYNLGLCIFEDVPAYRYSAENTTKLFEYMKCGLPIVTSDFPGLRRIVLECNCGIVVDPNSIDAIVDAIIELSKDPDKLKELGRNGYNAFIHKYNWSLYEQTLVDFVYNIYRS